MSPDNNTEREEKVLVLYKEGKTTRDIAKEQGLSSIVIREAIQQREKVQQSKDLYYQSEGHKQFYSICKDIQFYRWEYLLNNQEVQHNEPYRA